MVGSHSFDLALLFLRVALGVMIFLHGYNHLFGKGGVEGTARWFASIGFKPAKVHALMSGWIEIAIGPALVFGLFTALACSALIGIMSVAGVAAHRRNGFFIFRDGYEYVLVVAVVALGLAILGPGGVSLDSSLGIVDYDDQGASGLVGLLGGGLAFGLGVGGAIALLALSWRPVRSGSTT